MTGLFPPNHGAAAFGPPPAGAAPGPGQHPPTGPIPFLTPGYPGFPPQPVAYPRRPRRRRIFGALLVGAVVVTLAGLIGYPLLRGGSNGGEAIAEAPARAAIQSYLNALLDRDIDTIARNAACGIYGAVTDRRPDNAVAKMSSDAFRKQFARTEVTSIDKMVYLSRLQAQALFTMRVTPTFGKQQRYDVQGVAQLLAVDGDVLVCSYALRTAGSN